LQVDIAALMMEKPVNERSRDVTEIVKNIVLGFCKINVPYVERLDIYGSVHIRADNCDIANFILNEHCYSSSRASSPTVTSAQTVAVESEENGDNLQGQQNAQKQAIKIETTMSLSAETEKNQVVAADVPFWSRPDAELLTRQHQWNSLLQHSSSSAQPETGSNDNSTFHSVGADSSRNVVPDVTDCVKSEAALDEDQCSADGRIIEISDDDLAGCTQYTDYDGEETGEFKPDYFSSLERYEYDESFLQYEDSDAAAYQYPSELSASVYFCNQAGAATSTKRHRPNYAFSVGQNALPSTAEKRCSFCQETFASNAELQAHYQQCHQSRVPNAGSVQKRQKSRSHSVNETAGSRNVPGSLVRSTIQLYHCRYCGKTFRSYDGCRNHENISHNGSKRYRCKFCLEEFLTSQQCYAHRIKFHRHVVPRKMQ